MGYGLFSVGGGLSLYREFQIFVKLVMGCLFFHCNKKFTKLIEIEV